VAEGGREALMAESNSERVFRESCRIFPGGVNSPVRSFSSVGGEPFVVKSGSGPWLYDLDGKRYLDYVMSWGPLILGHAYPDVVVAIGERAKMGTSFGAPTEDEFMLGSLVCERIPWIEKLRFVSSGTEACMTAIRIARAATGRNEIVKFDGCYHGHSDSFLIKAGSGMATGGLPSSAGVLESVSENTISLPYNNIDMITKRFTEMGGEIAAVIVEPIAANMGVVPPVDGFLKTLRDLTSQNNSLLIFDEVITGFRVASGGAAELFDIKPDLVCLGKILGGGMPVGAVGGRKELLDLLAPLGKVYQAGTLSGNPISMAAGIATLRALFNPDIYKNIKQYADDLTCWILELAHKYGVSIRINKVESLFTLFFSDEEVIDFESAGRSDMNAYSRFFHHMLKAGVFVPPSGYEAWFVSSAHGKEQLEITIDAINDFLENYAKEA
jgi:glutamate-1-semialdehyde 2,1-aminomutase